MTDVGMDTVVTMLPREVLKRDGRRTAFVAAKIRSALLRAGQATGEYGEAEADLLTTQVVKVLLHSLRGTPPEIERIQDVVEQSLIAANHLDTARAYIVYRETHKKLRQDRKTVVDVEASINEPGKRRRASRCSRCACPMPLPTIFITSWVSMRSELGKATIPPATGVRMRSSWRAI